MARRLELDELAEHFTLLPEEAALLRNKSGATRLGFALLLKFVTRMGRFPSGRGELADEVVEFVARQVGVAASDLGFYDWSGRQVKAHRAEIRAHLGLRECSVADAGKLTAWLAGHVTQAERRPELVRAELLARCREERIEPSTRTRIDRIVASALHQGEETLFTRVASRLLPEVTARLEALIAAGDDGAEENHVGEEGPPVLALIKADPGNVSLDSMLAEIGKLRAVRAAGLPAGLFADVAPRVVAARRAQAMVESPSHLRAHPNTAKTLTLLAALLHARQQEITDTLVDLLISTVHRINARAAKKVTEQLVNAFKKVTGKENILFSIAQASLAAPDDPVRAVVYPAVSGGEQTLRELVHEYKTRGPVYRTTVATTLRASYTGHYRRGLVQGPSKGQAAQAVGPPADRTGPHAIHRRVHHRRPDGGLLHRPCHRLPSPGTLSRSDASRPMANSRPAAHPGKIQATRRASRTPYQNTWLLTTDPATVACWPTAARTNPPTTRTSHVIVSKARPRD